jgi:Flp pilus assembly pilin Flp
MRKVIKLCTGEGNNVSIVLQHWGSGLDRNMRRWTCEDGFWQCLDSGEIADECGFNRPSIFGPRKTAAQSHALAVHDAHETAVKSMRGQTMVEYALIIAAIGVVAWGAYNLTGHDIGSMANGIDTSLTSA